MSHDPKFDAPEFPPIIARTDSGYCGWWCTKHARFTGSATRCGECVGETCEGCGDRCDICGDRMCTTWGPAPATTCAAHYHCVDCDRDNPCRDCADERRAS